MTRYRNQLPNPAAFLSSAFANNTAEPNVGQVGDGLDRAISFRAARQAKSVRSASSPIH